MTYDLLESVVLVRDLPEHGSRRETSGPSSSFIHLMVSKLSSSAPLEERRWWSLSDPRT